MSGQLPKKMNCGRATRPLRIAMVYSRTPFPMMRGDQLTVAHLISFLAERGHAVDLFDIATDGEMDQVQEEWLRGACNRVHLYHQSVFAKVVGLLLGLIRLVPMQIGVFRHPKLRRDLRDSIERGEYDLVYCYYPRTAPAVPRLGDADGPRTFLALQLSQTLNTLRMAREEKSRVKRLVFRLEAVLMSRYEARIWKAFDRVVLIGPADVAAVKEQCRKHKQPEIDNWVYGAHGTDTERYIAATPSEIVPDRVVFSGSMLYPPNIQAVLWFVENVWPAVRAECPRAEFIIQGRDPAEEVRALDGKDGIIVTGTVPDVGVIIRSAQVCVNPVRAAGGMQNKLIEYMASAKAVVATSIANEGIQAPPDALVIADTPGDFAKQVTGLLKAPEDALRLGMHARSYVNENWTWEKHFLDLERNFYSALGLEPAMG